MQALHSPALSTIQDIQTDVVGAIEESFAYVISGELSEKQDFEYSARKLPEANRRFESFAKLDDPEKAEQKATYERFLQEQRNLLAGAQQMFIDFEKNGAVSIETFHIYEDSIDKIDFILDDLVAAQRLNVEKHFESSLSLVSQAGLILTVMGAVVLLIAGFIAILAGRQMSGQALGNEEQGGSLTPSSYHREGSRERSRGSQIAEDSAAA
jgi:hypothetical protein